MKNLILSSVFALIASSAAKAQEAVQWRVQDGGNGHWYQFARQSTNICWSEAASACLAKGGHLVTLTSGSENEYVKLIVSGNDPGVLEGGPFIGGVCVGGTWGTWQWVTGEQFGYTAWNPGEPNNAGDGECYLQFWRWSSLGWNDTSDCSSRSFVCEWSADCNGDGVVDFGQILSGDLLDLDRNNVPDCCERFSLCDPCPGDITNGGTVDATDLSIVLAAWGTNGQGEFQADIDGSGLVDGGDLALVLGGWGPCPE